MIELKLYLDRMISGNCVAGPRMLFSNQCLFNLLVKLRTHLMLIAHPCKFQQKKRSMVIAEEYSSTICVYFMKCMIGEEK